MAPAENMENSTKPLLNENYFLMTQPLPFPSIVLNLGLARVTCTTFFHSLHSRKFHDQNTLNFTRTQCAQLQKKCVTFMASRMFFIRCDTCDCSPKHVLRAFRLNVCTARRRSKSITLSATVHNTFFVRNIFICQQ